MFSIISGQDDKINVRQECQETGKKQVERIIATTERTREMLSAAEHEWKTKNNNPEKGEERKEEEKKIGVGKNDGKKGKKMDERWWWWWWEGSDGRVPRQRNTGSYFIYLFPPVFSFSFLFIFIREKKKATATMNGRMHTKRHWEKKKKKKDDRCCLYFFVFRLDCTAYRLRCLANKIFRRSNLRNLTKIHLVTIPEFIIHSRRQ